MIKTEDLQDRATRPSREWLTAVEVAQYWRLHVKTVYRRVRSGDLPATRLPDGQIRIRENDAKTYGRRIAIGAHGAIGSRRGQ